VAEPPLDNPRSLTAKVATVLGGTAVAQAGLSGFLNSRFDPFLNQLFASAPVKAREGAEAPAGHPGFVWLIEEPNAVMHGMTAAIGKVAEAPPIHGEIVDVRSPDELAAWHEVYCDVFGGDLRGREEWQRIHDSLGAGGDRTLLLFLARVDGSPAATGAVYFEADVAGLYCFTTREQMRGRGLASALVHASHAAARARGIERAVLQATASGRPVYAKAGYREEQTLPVLVSRL
jgi:GNAT superfamily N-acetyltransferase